MGLLEEMERRGETRRGETEKKERVGQGGGGEPAILTLRRKVNVELNYSL